MTTKQAATPQAPPLYCEYEQIIDTIFAKLSKVQIANIKNTVAKADQVDRGGLAKLKDFMARHGKALRDRETIAHILKVCESDQAAYDHLVKEQFTAGLERLPSGSYRVRVSVEHNQIVKTFKTKVEATRYRDRLIELDRKLKSEPVEGTTPIDPRDNAVLYARKIDRLPSGHFRVHPTDPTEGLGRVFESYSEAVDYRSMAWS